MSSLRLEDYDMSKERGYLCRFNAEEIELSGVMKQVRDVALRMPQILPTGRVREIIAPMCSIIGAALTLKKVLRSIISICFSISLEAKMKR